MFRTLKSGGHLVRLFDPSQHGQMATTFRHFGPLRRFDHHRASPIGPAVDPNRGISYASFKLSGCLVEVFGDTGIVDCGEWHVARIEIVSDLRLLNLTGVGAMRAGSVTGLTQAPDHALAQNWARYIYTDAAYRHCDGILYANAHNGEPAVALFERAAIRIACPSTSVIRLDHAGLRAELLSIARRHNMICQP